MSTDHSSSEDAPLQSLLEEVYTTSASEKEKYEEALVENILDGIKIERKEVPYQFGDTRDERLLKALCFFWEAIAEPLGKGFKLSFKNPEFKREMPYYENLERLILAVENYGKRSFNEKLPDAYRLVTECDLVLGVIYSKIDKYAQKIAQEEFGEDKGRSFQSIRAGRSRSFIRNLLPSNDLYHKRLVREREIGRYLDFHILKFLRELKYWELGFFRKEKTEEFLLDSSLYVYPNDVAKLDEKFKFELARSYDKRGILPTTTESLDDFVYRANAVLYLNQLLQAKQKGIRVNIDNKNPERIESIKLDVIGEKHVQRKDILEANKLIPYHMDLSWVTAFVCSSLLVPSAEAITLTLPHYGNFSFIQMKEEYKNREFFIKVLAHEMTHVGTTNFDTSREFLETKAYFVGGGILGEYATTLGAKLPLPVRIAGNIVEKVVPFLPWGMVKHIIPRMINAAKVYVATKEFKAVKERLIGHYGEVGNYLVGRLSGDEIHEMHYTNNIPARIGAKDSLKWRIMKENMQEFL